MRRPLGDGSGSSSIDWERRLGTPTRRFLARLEQATMGVDRAVDRVTGPGRFNPLHHTGTITTFLVLVIVLTGVYLTMFYQFGFDASYGAVEVIESRWIGRIVRAAHRYASIGAVVMTLIHAWRTFVMDRFRGPRWVPWVSGIGMTSLLWLAGVTGYWMIWDARSGPLNDALAGAISSSRLGLDFLLDMVLTEAAGSGWAFILVLFTVHILLTGAIASFYWFHVKRLSRRRFLPPPEWLWVTGLALLAISAALPVGMLPALDSSKLVESIPFDPFFMFLLPPALDWPPVVTWGGAALVLMGALVVPWLLRRREALPPILIDEERCTGCTLCVVDCPYRAIHMEPRSEGRHRQLAVINPNLCVSCGICIGSCPDLAMTFGETPAELISELLRFGVERACQLGPTQAVFTCERHILNTDLPWNEPVASDEEYLVITPLPCVGMVHPDLVEVATDAGAYGVRFVGCPSDDCANLEGNTWLQDRLNRDRLPRLAKDLESVPLALSWATPGRGRIEQDVSDAEHASSWVRPGALLIVGLLALVLATRWTYQPPVPAALIQISLDHQPGHAIEGFERDMEIPMGPVRLEVTLDGETVLDEVYPLVDADDAPTSLALEKIPANPGTHDVRVIMHGSDSSIDLFDDVIALETGQVFSLDYRDQPPSQSAEEGRKIFVASSIGASAGCQICHSIESDRVLVGPSLYGIADDAGERVPGLDAETYIRQSILDPDAYIVEGFPPGQMLTDFGTRLSEDEIENLVAYLLTLTGETK